MPGRSAPIVLPRTNAGLKLLQRARDEAHRFGLKSHRRARGKRALESPLLAIRGLGPARVRTLLARVRRRRGRPRGHVTKRSRPSRARRSPRGSRAGAGDATSRRKIRSPLLHFREEWPPSAADSRSRMMLTGGSLERTPFAEVVRSVYRERATAKLLVSAGRRGADVLVRPGPDPLRELEPRGPARRRAPADVRPRGREPPHVGLREGARRARSGPRPGAHRIGRRPGLRRGGRRAGPLGAPLLRHVPWTTGVFTVTPLETAPGVPAQDGPPDGRPAPRGAAPPARARVPAQLPSRPGARPVFAPDLLLRYQAFTVSAVEAEVLGRIDGSMTVEQIHPDQRVVARLAATGLVHLVAPGAARSRRAGVAEGLLFLNVEIAGAAARRRASPSSSRSSASSCWNTYRRLDWASTSTTCSASSRTSRRGPR